MGVQYPSHHGCIDHTSGSPITVTYVVTRPAGAGCVGATVNVVITVNPARVITAAQAKTICSGAA